MSRAPIAKVAGVCGWPIHHSLSPLLHTCWLRAAGVHGAYIPFMVKPWEAQAAFASLKRTTIVGVNVTLPLKGDAVRAADRVTDEALTIGASNCLYKRGGQLIAHNTDIEGFAAPLLEHRSREQLGSAAALVIGAGGAARAVVGALLSLGVPEIIITNRTDAKADALASEAGLPSFYALPWAERQSAIARVGLIVNASSAGMNGYPALDVDLSHAQGAALAYDLVYVPEMTPFLIDAQGHGLDTVGGLAMLIAQARPSFELFYDVPVPDLDPAPLLREALRTGLR